MRGAGLAVLAAAVSAAPLHPDLENIDFTGSQERICVRFAIV
jgi:hypothetical protein